MNVCPHFVLFCLIWIKNSIPEISTKISCVIVCLMKISTMNDVLYLGGINELVSIITTFIVQFG